MTSRDEYESYAVMEAFLPPGVSTFPLMDRVRADIEAAGARVGMSFSTRRGAVPLCRRCGTPIRESADDVVALKGLHRLCRHLDQYHSATIDADQWCGHSGCPNEPHERESPIPVRPDLRSFDELWCEDPIQIARWNALIQTVGPRVGMYIGRPQLSSAVSYLYGFDHALEFEGNERSTGPLQTFRNWLARRHTARNLVVESYIRQEAVPEIDPSEPRRELTPEEDERATSHLFAIFGEYLGECAERLGDSD